MQWNADDNSYNLPSASEKPIWNRFEPSLIWHAPCRAYTTNLLVFVIRLLGRAGTEQAKAAVRVKGDQPP